MKCEANTGKFYIDGKLFTRQNRQANPESTIIHIEQVIDKKLQKEEQHHQNTMMFYHILEQNTTTFNNPPTIPCNNDRRNFLGDSLWDC